MRPGEHGASQEAWHHWAERLGLVEHLLPAVANPGAEISPDSRIQTLGKTPTRYNFRRQVSGFPRWTEYRATMKDIGKWSFEPDYGICLQSRDGSYRAIDIDVPLVRRSQKIVEVIEKQYLSLDWRYRRTREGTGKLLLPFRYEGELPKRVLHVDGGMIEILGDGQQWIVDSSYLAMDTYNETTHKQKVSGRYRWPAGFPRRRDDVPLLTLEELDELCNVLATLFGHADDKQDGTWRIARVKRERTLVPAGENPGGDPIANWLHENWETRGEGSNSKLYIRCPFDSSHSSDSGPTETAYLPSGTNGYERGHFKCLHAHCHNRSDDDFLGALGYSIAHEFPLLEWTEGEAGGADQHAKEAADRYMIDKQGRKENRPYNHMLFLQSAECGKRIAYDQFTDHIVWCAWGDKPGEERWKLFADQHYTQIVRQMDRNGFVPLSSGAIRDSVYDFASQNVVDTAIDWLTGLPKWDGVKRIERFLPDYLHSEDTEYTRAVGRYIWTALAARVMEPGAKADMVPVLVGQQDRRKTTMIENLVPHDTMYVEIDLAHRDEETARKLRGVIAAELNELKGLRGRQAESIKAFLTRRLEKWRPVYKEYTVVFRRRCLFFGTTNAEEGFLNDPTGERRWLPFEVSVNGRPLEVDRQIADRNQLWAEGLSEWRANGVAWRDAERLAKGEHYKYKEHDSWSQAARQWLLTDDPMAGGAPVDRPYGWTAADALIGGLGFRMKEIKLADKQRMGRVLVQLGAVRKRVRQGSHLEWMYAVSREKIAGGQISG
jgi:hypothetical protein